MEVRFEGPVPFRLRLNRWMIGGMVVFVLGVAAWAIEIMTGPKESAVFHGIAYATVLAGISLYFIGRVVQLIAHFRSQRKPEPPHDA
jgi:uncharacterized membrane protein YGL010W